MVDEIKAPVAGSPKGWWRVAFGLSVALNLGIAGIVAGVLIRGAPGMPHADMVRDLGFGPYTEALSEADRDALRKSFRQHAPDLRAARIEMRADLDALLTALRARPFDQAALDAALARQSARLNERLTLGHSMMRERLLVMSDAEREAFADRLEKSVTRHRPKS